MNTDPWDFEQFDDEDDFREDADDDGTDDCGCHPDGDGGYQCHLIGSEQCEFCPNRHLMFSPEPQPEAS